MCGCPEISGSTIDASLWPKDSFRYYELAYRNFAAYAHERSFELISMGAQDLITSIYGPQNMLANVIPGPLGNILGFNDAMSTWRNSLDLISISEEAINIRINGPQIINEENWIRIWGQEYDQRLDHLVNQN